MSAWLLTPSMLDAWPQYRENQPEIHRNGSGIHVFSTPRNVNPWYLQSPRDVSVKRKGLLLCQQGAQSVEAMAREMHLTCRSKRKKAGGCAHRRSAIMQEMS